MYKLLIIDDEMKTGKREEIYKFMFSDEFEIKCIESDNYAFEQAIKSDYYDGVVMDNNLDKGMSRDMVLDKLSHYTYPIIMVSNSREFSLEENLNGKVIDYISLGTVISLRNLKCEDGMEQELVVRYLKELRSRIERRIWEYQGYLSKQNNKLVIAHISDVQYGDDAANTNDLRTIFEKLAECFNERENMVDVLVITGDIVFSGKKREFDIAKQQIDKFIHRMRDYHKPIQVFLVPGNHDFDYQYYEEISDLNHELESADGMIIDEKNLQVSAFKELKKGEASVIPVITPDMFSQFRAGEGYLSNFKQFAYEVTGEKEYLNDVFYIRNYKYANRGFAIIGINNAYHYRKHSDGTKQYVFEYESCGCESRKEPLFSVVAGHIDPESLGYNNFCSEQEDRCNEEMYRKECVKQGYCTKWGDMARFLQLNCGGVYLFGHTHFADVEVSQEEKYLFVGAGSPTGINDNEKTVNIVELERTQKKILAKIERYKAKPEGIRCTKTYQFSYSIDEKNGQKMNRCSDGFHF